MRALIATELAIGEWFAGAPSRPIVRLMREAAIIVASKKEAISWFDGLRELHPESDALALRKVLELMTVSLREAGSEGYEDYKVSSGGPNFEDLLDLEEFENLIDKRRTPPFVGAETSQDAFYRVFGTLLAVAEDWQVIDHFLLEQLMRDDDVLDFLISLIPAFPSKLELHSKSPAPEKTPEEFKRLATLKARFESEGKHIAVYEYWSKPHPNRRKFPHPRVQKARYSRGEVFTSLDNGLRSFLSTGPIDLGLSTRQTWTDAVRELKVMNCRSVFDSRR